MLTVAGRPLSPIGLGCMPLSHPEVAEPARAVATIHAALDAGARLLDTADAYCPPGDVGHNERVVARALREWGGDRDAVVVATKGGHTRPDGRWELDGRPEHLRAACEASLRALGTDRIDLYQLHRPDPRVPYAESVGAIAELRAEGKVVDVGLSNATVAQLEEAEAIVPIAAVQNELSPSYLAPLGKGEVEACERRGIAYLAYSPLGGVGAGREASGRIAAIAQVAERLGASPQQVTLAWLRSLAPAVVPIPGSSRPETARASMEAAGLELPAEDAEAIGAALRAEPAAA
jgi:aryl-alcohol dehydrogenase-like predicted oxidoreductase